MNPLHEFMPLRTRERAAVEVARRYLRAIAAAKQQSDVQVQWAEEALAEIAKALGERA